MEEGLHEICHIKRSIVGKGPANGYVWVDEGLGLVRSLIINEVDIVVASVNTHGDANVEEDADCSSKNESTGVAVGVPKRK